MFTNNESVCNNSTLVGTPAMVAGADTWTLGRKLYISGNESVENQVLFPVLRANSITVSTYTGSGRASTYFWS